MSPWIPILLIAFALSPIVWLVPSKRQRSQGDIRVQARRMGLPMQLMPQDWPYWLEPLPPSPCPQYYSAGRRAHKDSWCYWQNGEGQWLNKWREPCVDPELLAQLRLLPGDVYKAEASEQMVALYWGERGSGDALQCIADFLKARA